MVKNGTASFNKEAIKAQIVVELGKIKEKKAEVDEIFAGDLNQQLVVQKALRELVSLVRQLRILSVQEYKRDENYNGAKSMLGEILGRQKGNWWAQKELELLADEAE